MVGKNKIILYNKARNDQWEESPVCMTVIARYGTGGNNMPILLEVSNIGTQYDDKNNNVNRPLQPRSKPKRGDNS